MSSVESITTKFDDVMLISRNKVEAVDESKITLLTTLSPSYRTIINFYTKYYNLSRISCINFGVPNKLVRLIETCLDGAQGKVRIGNSLFSSFSIEKG